MAKKTIAGKKNSQQKPVKKAAAKAPKKTPPKKTATSAATKTASRKETKVNKADKKATTSAPASKSAKGLSAKDLAYFKKKLEAEKLRVLEEVGEIQNSNLKQTVADQAGELSHYSYHLGDTASLSYDREFSMGLAERQQKYLEQIDEALARIAEGTYGICKVTGEPIARERLEEVPVAKYSVKGKEILERQKRMAPGA